MVTASTAWSSGAGSRFPTASGSLAQWPILTGSNRFFLRQINGADGVSMGGAKVALLQFIAEINLIEQETGNTRCLGSFQYRTRFGLEWFISLCRKIGAMQNICERKRKSVIHVEARMMDIMVSRVVQAQD